MEISRRTFLVSLGAAGAASAFGQSLPPAASRSRQQALQPHTPVFLDRNENAYGPSEKVLGALRAGLTVANRYPRVACDALVAAIAKLHRVTPNQVLLGCGSTEILCDCAYVFLGRGRRLVIAQPTFGLVAHEGRAAGTDIVQVPLTQHFAHDLDAMLAKSRPQTALVYICNPNNPTGTVTPRKDIENFIAKLPHSTYVLIDEAYHEYAGTSESYISFLDRPPAGQRVIVTRTFSHAYGLAGLRVGYAIGSEPTIQRLRSHRLPDSVSEVAAYAATAAIEDRTYVQYSAKRNADDRQEFFNQAQARMLKPLDSRTNFFMMNVGKPAKQVVAHFRERNVYIRGGFPLMPNYIRVSLGTPLEMREFWRVWDSMPSGPKPM